MCGCNFRLDFEPFVQALIPLNVLQFFREERGGLIGGCVITATVPEIRARTISVGIPDFRFQRSSVNNDAAAADVKGIDNSSPKS
jgi:hypothetical protein